jgi:hypothetical protein
MLRVKTNMNSPENTDVISKAIQKLSWIMEKANSVENLKAIDFDDLNYIARTANDARQLLQRTIAKA